MGEQYVGIDLHRRRSVIARMTPEGEVLETVRIDNDPVALSLELAKAGPDPEVVLERRPAPGVRCHGPSGPPTGGQDVRLPAGPRPTPATRPTWVICCAWVGCPRRGWPRQLCGSCASWCATGPSWWRCAAASRPKSTPGWPRKASGCR